MLYYTFYAAQGFAKLFHIIFIIFVWVRQQHICSFYVKLDSWLHAALFALYIRRAAPGAIQASVNIWFWPIELRLWKKTEFNIPSWSQLTKFRCDSVACDLSICTICKIHCIISKSCMHSLQTSYINLTLTLTLILTVTETPIRTLAKACSTFCKLCRLTNCVQQQFNEHCN